MDKLARDIVMKKLGELMVVNAEIAAENVKLAGLARDQAADMNKMRERIAFLEQMTNEPRLPLNGVGEGEEANGAGVH